MVRIATKGMCPKTRLEVDFCFEKSTSMYEGTVRRADGMYFSAEYVLTPESSYFGEMFSNFKWSKKEFIWRSDSPNTRDLMSLSIEAHNQYYYTICFTKLVVVQKSMGKCPLTKQRVVLIGSSIDKEVVLQRSDGLYFAACWVDWGSPDEYWSDFEWCPRPFTWDEEMLVEAFGVYKDSFVRKLGWLREGF